MVEEKKQLLLKKFEKKRKLTFWYALMLDLMGAASYVVPIYGELIDIIWAPISAVLIKILFKGSKTLTLVEEGIPFTDIVPSGLINWNRYYKKNELKTLEEFLKEHKSKEDIVSNMVS
ncbi:hypothetical protein EJF36_18860 [Bacillus sp. HMF5848]|uniref:hypothetical protein n=1 Tax=Bacillus sp. HMF5848 TaxID=2495421 RepID=UPI000F786038|nr:hypothetical protein [Bacillus sp. HMF5848]RSK28768.1 hypothetical protein EJF36_18860 [Bacillus sp. HMF5848]